MYYGIIKRIFESRKPQKKGEYLQRDIIIPEGYHILTTELVVSLEKIMMQSYQACTIRTNSALRPWICAKMSPTSPRRTVSVC